jgi:hypothetical protein
MHCNVIRDDELIKIEEHLKLFYIENTSMTSTNVLSKRELLRIKHATTRINRPVLVVGSRANRTVCAYQIQSETSRSEW